MKEIIDNFKYYYKHNKFDAIISIITAFILCLCLIASFATILGKFICELLSIIDIINFDLIADIALITTIASMLIYCIVIIIYHIIKDKKDKTGK